MSARECFCVNLYTLLKEPSLWGMLGTKIKLKDLGVTELVNRQLWQVFFLVTFWADHLSNKLLSLNPSKMKLLFAQFVQSPVLALIFTIRWLYYGSSFLLEILKLQPMLAVTPMAERSQERHGLRNDIKFFFSIINPKLMLVTD